MSDGVPSTIEVVDVPERERFEALVNGAAAGFSQYRRRGDRIVFTHTEVDPAFEGGGVEFALARQALEAVRAAGLRVDPRCPFIAAWIRRHKEYADLVVTT